MIFTNFREIDKLGRIVISKDIRRHLNIHAGLWSLTARACAVIASKSSVPSHKYIGIGGKL